MNRLVYIAAAGALLVSGAAAQNPEDVAKMKAELDGVMKMKMVGAVTGMTVKGAPYSGEEVSETNQVLADGTRIHRENRTTVYRDSEGRTRRETPDNITITDHSVHYQRDFLTINYQAGFQNGTRGVTSLTLNDGFDANQIDVESVGQFTTTVIYGYADDSVWGPAAGKVIFIKKH